MKPRSIAGVFVGGVIDIVATALLVSTLLEVLGALLGLEGAVWLLGLFATVLGGYAAASIAQTAHVRSGALSSWLCVLLGVYGIVTGVSGGHLWQDLLGLILSPTFGAFGGYLQLRQRQWSGRALEA